MYYCQVMKLPSGASIDTDGGDLYVHVADVNADIDANNAVLSPSSPALSLAPAPLLCGWIAVPTTKPHTKDRDWVYKRTVYVHLICIHVLANILAIILVLQLPRNDSV